MLLASEDSVLALSPRSGRLRWASHVPGRFSARPAWGEGEILIVSAEGELSRLDPATGRLLAREHRTPTQLAVPLGWAGRVTTVSAGGVVESRGSPSDFWVLELDEAVASSPIAAGSLFLIGTGKGRLAALRADRGSTVWNLSARGGFRVAPLLTPTGLALATDQGQVYVYAHLPSAPDPLPEGP